MSDPGKGIDLTNEILKEILVLLRWKADQDNTQELHEAPNQDDDASSAADTATQEPVNTGTVDVETANDNENLPREAVAATQGLRDTEALNVQTDNVDDWPNDKNIARYRDRCARHKSECEKMQVELGFIIAHLGIVGGEKYVIRTAESLRDILLVPVRCLESALGVTPGGRKDAMGEVGGSISSLWANVNDFAWCLRDENASYSDKVEQWKKIARNGRVVTDELLHGRQYLKCLEFIHDELFTDLETAMSGFVEALTTWEEKSASEWLATQTIADLERRFNDYIGLPMDEIKDAGNLLEPDKIRKFGKRLAEHKRLSNNMEVELDHLISHYTVIGGDKAVIEATTSLKQDMLSYIQCLERAVREKHEDVRTEMCDVVRRLFFAVFRFHNSLYHQKHAFYFRKVKEWVTCTWIGALGILNLLHRGEVSQCHEYIHNTFLSRFERAMIGMAHGEQLKLGNGALYAVPEELKTFGKESLPKFLVDQMERDTTRYINLTTIATFFSSVTATTLQFTYAPLQSEASASLRGVVNLFWFLSLVFSVSSAVSSLLGLTWRKSSIYDLRHPPWPIHMWFDKAPMLFLITSAVAFVIGLNLFAYLSLQPRFVSLATNILTGMHGMCLLAVTLWFIYQLKHDTVWAKWIGKVLRWIGDLRVWKCIRKAWKWMKDVQISTWRWIRHPRREYREKKLHLRRNIFWAFGIDNRVARLNFDIAEQDCHRELHHEDWDRDWPKPYRLSKIIRLIAYPTKKGWLATKKIISDLGHSVRKNICSASRAVDTEGNIELGERGGWEDPDVHEESSPESRAEKAENEFRKSLQNIFSDVAGEKIISDIKQWEVEYVKEYAARLIRIRLWGYPTLIDMFFDDVRPALKEAREDSERKREEAQQEGQALAQIDVDTHHQNSNDENQDMHEDTSFSRQTQCPSTSQAPECPDSIEIDACHDSQAHPDDHSPSSDKSALPTASEEREGLEPTAGNPNERLDVLVVRERLGQQNEIAEIPDNPFTSDDATEGSQIAQSREEAAE